MIKKFVAYNLIIALIITFGVATRRAVQSRRLAEPIRITSIADSVERVIPAVVHISKEGVCQGSGCIMSEDGIIFTAKHVTDGGGDFVITLNDGRTFEVQRCIEHDDYDIAFLKIDVNEPLPYANLADYHDLRLGDPLFIIGSPFGYENFNSVTQGILSAKQRNLDAERDYGYGWEVTFQTDATAQPGNSGGPVFNIRGDVVGILVAGMSPTTNYAVPVSLFIPDLQLIKYLFMSEHYTIREPAYAEWGY